MAGVAGLWTDLTVQLRADRKKALVLLGLAAVLITVVLRATLLNRQAPAQASAASELLPAAGGPTIVQPAAAPVNHLAPSAGAGGAASDCETVDIAIMPRSMARDLFHTDWNAFPPSAESLARNEKKAAVASSRPSMFKGAWESIAALVEQRQLEVRNARDRAARDAADLHLQATFGSDPPRAIISGRTVSVGDVIGGFRITAISSRQVTVLKSGLSVELTMP